MYIPVSLFMLSILSLFWFLLARVKSRLIDECQYLRARGNVHLRKKYRKIFYKALLEVDIISLFILNCILVCIFSITVFGYASPRYESEHKTNTLVFLGTLAQCCSVAIMTLLYHFMNMRTYDYIARETNEADQEKAIATTKKILMRSS